MLLATRNLLAPLRLFLDDRSTIINIFDSLLARAELNNTAHQCCHQQKTRLSVPAPIMIQRQRFFLEDTGAAMVRIIPELAEQRGIGGACREGIEPHALLTSKTPILR